MAARCPPGPEPITISSYGCIHGFLCSRFVRGIRGVGLDVFDSISEQRRRRSGDARRVTVEGRSDAHQVFLHGESVTVADGSRTRVGAIGRKNARLASVGQIGGENFNDAMAELRIF